MEKVRACKKCLREKELKFFSRKTSGLSVNICRTCLLAHRLDNNNRSKYPGTSAQDEDWRVTVDSILEGLG